MNPPVALSVGSSRLLQPPAVGASLADLRPGMSGVVAFVSGTGTLRRRLLELGFVAGTSVRVVRLAPLGDPMEVELHGYHLSLRRSEARTVGLRQG